MENIFVYGLGKFGVERVQSYVVSLNQAFIMLADNPKLGRERECISSGLCAFNAGSHVIFYRLRKPQGVTVIRVLHNSMDYIRHLN